MLEAVLLASVRASMRQYVSLYIRAYMFPQLHISSICLWIFAKLLSVVHLWTKMNLLGFWSRKVTGRGHIIVVEALHATFALFCELFFLVHISFYGHTKYMFVCTYLNFIFILYSNAITALFLLPSFNSSDLGRKNNMFFCRLV